MYSTKTNENTNQKQCEEISWQSAWPKTVRHQNFTAVISRILRRITRIMTRLSGGGAIESVQDFSIKLGHIYASSRNKHFFTKSCHHQTYQNHEQSRQILGTILQNKVSQKSKFSKTFFSISWSLSPIFFLEIFFWKDLNNI